ncbi:MAG TPA: hypothetical protein VGC21_04630 [Telluria sp.]
MKNVISGLLVAASVLTFPAHAAETVFTWQATALDSKTGSPVEGVQFNWTFVDKTINKTTTDVCVSNAQGICAVKLGAKKGIATGASVMGQALAVREGYEADVDYAWREDGNQKFLTAKMTALSAGAAATPAEQAEVEALRSQLASAIDKSGIVCVSKEQCDQLFILTESYLAKSADMKVQTVTPTTISTFNPSQPGAIAMGALRMRGKGDTSLISVSTSCKEDSENVKVCLRRQLRIVKAFKPFIEAAIMKQ